MTIIGLAVRRNINPTNLVMLYLLAVVIIAVFWGRGPAVFSAVLGVLCFDVFLVPPYLTFAVEDTEYIITFISLFLIGVLISSLMAQLKEQMLAARDREERVSLLYELSKKLAIAYSLTDVINSIQKSIRQIAPYDSQLFLLNDSIGHMGESKKEDFAIYPGLDGNDSKIIDDVVTVCNSGKPSEIIIEPTLGLPVIYFPLASNLGNIGAISFFVNHSHQEINPDMRKTFEAFANLSALAIERVNLSNQANKVQLIKAKEEMQSILLNSVSHDFRTPLVTITGALSSLNSPSENLNHDDKQSMIKQALREAEKLNRLVSNLLNINRLESDILNIQKDPVDVEDLIGSTIDHMEDYIDRSINVTVSEKSLYVLGDFVFLQQALINVIDNAVKYSPDCSPLEMKIYNNKNFVIIEVKDYGGGIPEEEIPNIFRKFYRGEKSRNGAGTGLGLTIVKGIIDAHNGTVKVISSKEERWTIIQISLPCYLIPEI
ncbi:MAG: DUF4118 domain-containing protein [Anaerolineales bacterium]|nr:DUF4118 domain-containing protein [Anaerolineales bacterium]